jgi:hypothetical protein
VGRGIISQATRWRIDRYVGRYKWVSAVKHPISHVTCALHKYRFFPAVRLLVRLGGVESLG